MSLMVSAVFDCRLPMSANGIPPLAQRARSLAFNDVGVRVGGFELKV